ncbi:MAG: exo-alpha-sialidase, partial [Actinomycetota bacterium]|nr:exo-alpha-sialidase [Actinomycetota bacterium]
RVVGAGAFSVAYVGDGSDQAVAVTQRGIETSQDGGRTWQVVTQPGVLPGRPAARAGDGHGAVWVVTEEPRSLQRSHDGGRTWEEVARA